MSEKYSIIKTYSIPLKYKEGIYSFNNFENLTGDMLLLDYDESYQILDYILPGSEGPVYRNKITFYSIPQDKFESTLKAFYASDGCLRKVTMDNGSKEILLYIYYENMETARQEIKDFAIGNADDIIEKICICKDTVARLFIEYFNDGACLDFHARIGTDIYKNKLLKKYPDDKYNVIDNSGNYPVSGIINGNNEKLMVMVLCANNYEMDFFQYAVNIMIERIGEKAPDRLNKTDDFKYICEEYD